MELPHVLPRRFPARRSLGTGKDLLQDDEVVDAEWNSLVDMEMAKSPRSAHLQMREHRRWQHLHRAKEKDRLNEMKAKLERYELNLPEYERSSTSASGPPRQTVVPFSQKRQQEILEEFQRQSDLQTEKEEQAEKMRWQQHRQKLKEEKRRQRRAGRSAQAADFCGAPAEGSKGWAFFGGFFRLLGRKQRWPVHEVREARPVMAASSVEVERPPSDATLERQKEMLIEQVEELLLGSQLQPASSRRKIFRELQRKLHPDKNDGGVAFHLAFQHLMDRQEEYLRE